MDVIHERVAGLDVHKDTVVACVRIMSGARAGRTCRTFGTTTAELTELRDWLDGSGCTQVAMEATGVYWKPVWNILSDGGFDLILANAAHIKAVPGRKTDMNDAMWIADLAACGLIRGTPGLDPGAEQKQADLRGPMRTRKQLCREQASHVQRLQKTLEEANIKLASVISDILGVNGRRMIEAMIAGVRKPHKLAELADRRLRASPKQLYDALHGRLTDHHRFLLGLHLRQYDALTEAIAAIDDQVEAQLTAMDQEEAVSGQARFRTLITLLSAIPGVSALSATTILSEIGRDMSRFDTAGHLVSWAGLCPGQNQSAGKRRATRLRKGAPWLKTMLVQCGWAASRAKNSYFSAQFRRLKSRRGPQKAVCAVAASLLTTIYHMLRDGTAYQDLGTDHFDRRPVEVKAKRLVGLLTKLGFDVELRPIAEAA